MLRCLFLVMVTLLFSISSFAEIPSQFFVGSYNLYGLRNSEKLKQDLNDLNFIQLWAFQEVEGDFSEETIEKILEILPQGNWYIYQEKVNKISNTKWEGQVIASRFPFESVEILPLEHTDKKRRIALIANFKTPEGKPFTFVNTDHEVDVFKIDFQDRKKQLTSLVRYFGQTNSPTVITGDFNTTDGDHEITKTENIMLQANFSRVKSEDDPTTFEKLFIKKELDHFFIRGIESSPRYKHNERKGSDHFPIYIEVHLR